MMTVLKESSNEILDKDNLRKTKARRWILDLLKDSGPKTAEEIHALTAGQNIQISLSTVYRTCETMAQKGILLRSNLMDDGLTRYEYRGMEHRHHAICMDCHKIIPIEDCPFGEFDKLMESKYGFEVENHRLEILGRCAECRKKHPRRTENSD